MKPDLNLLRLFDVLIDVRNVGRAADRLGLTQSAVSHALARLRSQLGDPLFLRARGGLRPTRRAIELGPTVRQVLALLDEAIGPAGFDPATTDRQFTISAGSYFAVTLLPLVFEQARAAAPHARFRIVAAGDDLLDDIDAGSIDVAFGGFSACPQRFALTPLFSERLVWVARAGSDVRDIALRPRLAMTRHRQFAHLDAILSGAPLDERIEIVPETVSPDAPVPLAIHDPLSALAFIRSSDLVALLPRQLTLRLTEPQGIACFEAEDSTPVSLSMLWPARAADDAGHRWLRELITAAAASLD